MIVGNGSFAWMFTYNMCRTEAYAIRAGCFWVLGEFRNVPKLSNGIFRMPPQGGWGEGKSPEGIASQTVGSEEEAFPISMEKPVARRRKGVLHVALDAGQRQLLLARSETKY